MIFFPGCKEGELIPAGNGWYIKPIFIPVTGSGELFQATFLENSGSPPNAQFSGEGISAGIAMPTKAILVTWQVLSRDIIQSPVEINFEGAIIRNAEITSAKLPDNIKVTERSRSAYSISYMATGDGEEQCNEVLARIWLEPIPGRAFNFWYEPWNDKSHNIQAEEITAWTFPVNVSTNTLIAEATVHIETDAKLLWVNSGNFFPLSVIEPITDSGDIVTRNVKTEWVYLGNDATPAAPPSEKAIIAQLEQKNIFVVYNNENGIKAIGPKGNIAFASEKTMAVEVSYKQPTTWGALKKE